MSSIVIAGDTSGSVTLSAPAVSGSSVLSLPAVTDTVAGIAATQTLTNKSIVATQLTGTIAAARLPTGSVLQVVSSVLGTSASTTSSSFTASGLSVSITPSSSSSKVFIIVAVAGGQTTSNGAGMFTIYRGATNLGNATDGFTYLYSNATFTNPFRVPVNMSFLDSPATTSSTTYQVYFKTNTVGTVQINDQLTNSTITVMEIAA